VEVKSSRADFQADGKWPGYLSWCDRFFFAVPAAFPEALLPQDQGLIRADAYGAEVVRPAPLDRLAAARRKAITLRFARLAAERLARQGSSLP
ncbi:MAG: MmcB family DNA repair protein, partial [Pseudomonadota bacterium]